LFGQVPQKYRELIATEARDDIRIAAASDDDFGNSLQRRIAGQVAELVVDAFEVIEIDKDDGGAAVVAGYPRDRPPQFALETSPVRNIEQRVRLNQRFKMSNSGVRRGELGFERSHAALDLS
jgi:hypothetical protein